ILENSCDDKQMSEIRQMPYFWLRKVTTAISAWDLDKDGHIGHDAMMNIADTFARVGNLNGKSGDNILEVIGELANPGRENPLSEIVKATSFSEHLIGIWRAKGNPASVKSLRKIYSNMFKIVDCNAAGFLTFDQYLVFWNIFNLDKRFAKMQFDYMDTDQSGKISEEQFMNTYRDYLGNTGDDTLNDSSDHSLTIKLGHMPNQN
ncbi:unnamed protein product, partial [Owenia fusiformis]